jgi:hypothetical protein
VDLEPEFVALHQQIGERYQQILYKGAVQRG